MNLIVVGCGRVGAELAFRLFQKGHKVTVIDQVAAAFGNLPSDFRGRTVEGEPLNREVLQRAGTAKADGLAAVTNSDSLNVVVAHVARTLYHLKNVVARNYNPRWRPVHEAFGLQVVSSAIWGAQRIEQMLDRTGVEAVLSAGNGEVAIYEILVTQAWEGTRMTDLLSEGEALPVAIIRAGQAVLPAPDLHLETGDVLLVSATIQGIDTLRQRLVPQGKDRCSY